MLLLTNNAVATRKISTNVVAVVLGMHKNPIMTPLAITVRGVATTSSLSRTKRHDNVLVLRTRGKHRPAIATAEATVAFFSSDTPRTIVTSGHHTANHFLTHSSPSSSSSSSPPPPPLQLQKPVIDFDDATSAHGSKTTPELIRALAVFEACSRLAFLVRNADRLLELSTKILGSTITTTLVKHTFFRHFCAGVDKKDMMPVIESLRHNNIGAILDYAAEKSDDGDNGNAKKGISKGKDEENSTSSARARAGMVVQPPINQPARIYDYKSESECDNHVSIFKECIRSVRDVSITSGGGGFAALKVTALGNPSKY